MTDNNAANNAPKNTGKKLSIDDLLAQKEALELKQKEVQAQYDAALKEVRDAELVETLKKVDRFKFTAEELGLVSAPPAEPQPQPAGSTPGTKSRGPRNTVYTLKSTKSDKKGIWLADPPKFIKEEGCIPLYKEGKNVDAWLIDPTNVAEKVKFLNYLATDQKQEPNKEQLGDISVEEFDRISGELAAKKEKADKAKANAAAKKAGAPKKAA